MSRALREIQAYPKTKKVNTDAAAELRRLHELNAELVAALSSAVSIIGHPDDAMSIYFESLIAKAKEQA